MLLSLSPYYLVSHLSFDIHPLLVFFFGRGNNNWLYFHQRACGRGDLEGVQGAVWSLGGHRREGGGGILPQISMFWGSLLREWKYHFHCHYKEGWGKVFIVKVLNQHNFRFVNLNHNNCGHKWWWWHVMILDQRWWAFALLARWLFQWPWRPKLPERW